MGTEAWVRFLEKLAGSPELRAEFVQLALRYGVDFTAGGELSDEDLGEVSGGAIADSLVMQNTQQTQQEATQTVSSLSKSFHDIAMSIIQNTKA